MKLQTKTKAGIAATVIAATSMAVYFSFTGCEKLFIDYSRLSPTQPSTPNYKWAQSFFWNGNEYLATSYGWGMQIFNDRGHSIADSKRLVCPVGQAPCPGIVPGDYDWPLERFAICDDARYMIANGKDGIGGTIVLAITAKNGKPSISEKGIISHGLTDVGAYTWIDNGEQYMITNLPHSSCGTRFRPRPSMWRIDSVNTVSYVGCFGEGFTVNGGIRLGNTLYLAASNQIVREYSWHDLSYRGVMPIRALYSDGLGMSSRGSLLAVSRIASVELWDVGRPLQPVLLSEISGHSVSSFFGLDRLWTAPRASSHDSSVWCISNPSRPAKVAGIAASKPNQLWQAGADIGDLYTLAGQVGVSVGSDCYPCQDEIFADGFESGDTSKWTETRRN